MIMAFVSYDVCQLFIYDVRQSFIYDVRQSFIYDICQLFIRKKTIVYESLTLSVLRRTCSLKKIISIIICAAVTASVLCGCGGGGNVTYKDGTYTGRSSVFENDDGSEDGNGYGEVTLTIKDGIISDCTYLTYEVDGTLKGEDYGKEDGRIANKDYYNKAQKANAACAEYASMLVANGQLEGIDSISGATINYNEFKEAVNNALKEAAE